MAKRADDPPYNSGRAARVGKMSCLLCWGAEMREDINETTELPPPPWSDGADSAG